MVSCRDQVNEFLAQCRMCVIVFGRDAELRLEDSENSTRIMSMSTSVCQITIGHTYALGLDVADSWGARSSILACCAVLAS
jgi:hypothetical protein